MQKEFKFWTVSKDLQTWKYCASRHHTHSYTDSYMHKCIYALTHTRTCTYMHTRTWTDACTYAGIHTQPHAPTRFLTLISSATYTVRPNFGLEHCHQVIGLHINPVRLGPGISLGNMFQLAHLYTFIGNKLRSSSMSLCTRNTYSS